MAQILAATQCGNCGATTRVVDTDNAGTWCAECLFSNVARENLDVFWAGDGYSECENCGDRAMYCENCAGTRSCAWCGDEAVYCSANCAWSDEGAPDDWHSSCDECGNDDAYYCSPECAYVGTGETFCSSCEDTVSTAKCRECRGEERGEGRISFEILSMPVAAEPIAGVDDTSVKLDGITFEFDIT